MTSPDAPKFIPEVSVEDPNKLLVEELYNRSRELFNILHKNQSEQDELLRYFYEHKRNLIQLYDTDPEKVTSILSRLSSTQYPEGSEFRATNFHHFGLRTTIELIPKLEADIKNGIGTTDKLDAISELARANSINDDYQRIGIRSLNSLLPQIADRITDFRKFELYSPYFGLVIRHGSKQDRQAVEKIIDEQSRGYSDQDRFSALYVLLNNPEDYSEIFNKYFSKRLQAVNLPPEEFQEAWYKASDPNKLRFTVMENFKYIAFLEAKRPSICEVLYKEFGIKNFGRYPVDLMVDQYDNRDNLGIKYGIISTPESDHNGGQYLKHHIFGALYRGMKDKIHLRVFESGNRNQFIRKLSNFNHRYNSQPEKSNPISFIYFGGHGLENSISLGDSVESDRIRVKDLKGSRVKKVRDFFAKKCPAILASCLTGNEGGFAESLANELDFTVYATDQIGTIDSVGIDWKEEAKPEFNVEYGVNKKGKFKAKVYKN